VIEGERHVQILPQHTQPQLLQTQRFVGDGQPVVDIQTRWRAHAVLEQRGGANDGLGRTTRVTLGGTAAGHEHPGGLFVARVRLLRGLQRALGPDGGAGEIVEVEAAVAVHTGGDRRRLGCAGSERLAVDRGERVVGGGPAATQYQCAGRFDARRPVRRRRRPRRRAAIVDQAIPPEPMRCAKDSPPLLQAFGIELAALAHPISMIGEARRVPARGPLGVVLAFSPNPPNDLQRQLATRAYARTTFKSAPERSIT
jgi:hypothetical protein